MFSRTRKPRACPKCQSRRIASIQYGMPAMDDELQQRIAAGKVVLGGCSVTENSPAWQCVDCQAEIFRDFGELDLE